ncbi:unnamed protein product [Clonostachys byssicola]|uniref:F-box domain-containing protein n=1 Tax=Clonostachys byssicola TaxID=160290 RepID=A0A9N9U5J9_9HYPO|nr:unnamed protein product [Clonostachys byssicola]
MEFPEEIWTQIFSQLIPQNDPHSNEKYYPYRPLRTLCLVSRSFRRLAQPILYHTVFIVIDRALSHRALKLLRTLYQCPSLARAVRSLSVASFCISDEKPNFSDKATFLDGVLQSLDIPSLLKAQLDIKPSSQEEMDAKEEMDAQEEVDEEEVDGVPMILALTTAVQHVDITISELNWHVRISHQLAGSMQPDGPDPPRNYANYGLPNLKHISINANDSPMNTSISYVEPALLRSDLISLRLAHVNWHSAWVEPVARPSRTCNLHSLILDDCIVDEVTLKDILKRYPKLRRLSLKCADGYSAVDIDNYDEGDVAPWTWRSGPFGDVLREYGKQLEELTLLTDFHRERIYGFSTPEDETMLGSFHDFPSLRKMEVSFRELFGPEDRDGRVIMDMGLFPPSLEEIVIPSNHGAHFREVLALMRNHALPKLRRVTLRYTCASSLNLMAISEKEIPGWTYLERKLLDRMPIKVYCLNFVKLPIEQNLL